MDSSRWGALGMVVAAALVIGAAGVGAGSPPSALGAPDRPRHGRSRVEAGIRPPPGAQDYYRCFEAPGCPGPALSGSTTCRPGRDYTVSAADSKDTDVTVLSFHGGLIEPGSSAVSALLARRFGWSRYDLDAHGTAACLDGWVNATRLHITSDHFDDRRAVALVGRHRRAVSIHGYDLDRNLSRGTICVGGRDALAVGQFIRSLARLAPGFAGYELVGVDSRWLPPADDGCSGLTGMGETNIVNRTSGDGGGLQLEMVAGLKLDLADPARRFDGLRRAFLTAVHDAMDR